MFCQIFKKLLNSSLLLILTCDNISNESLWKYYWKNAYIFCNIIFGFSLRKVVIIIVTTISWKSDSPFNFVRVLKIFWVILSIINIRQLWRIFPTSRLVGQASKRIQIAKMFQRYMFHVFIRNVLISSKIWIRFIKKWANFWAKQLKKQ